MFKNSILYLSIVELSVHIDLTFGDVASQIRNGMGDIWTEKRVVALSQSVQ